MKFLVEHTVLFFLESVVVLFCSIILPGFFFLIPLAIHKDDTIEDYEADMTFFQKNLWGQILTVFQDFHFWTQIWC